MKESEPPSPGDGCGPWTFVKFDERAIVPVRSQARHGALVCQNGQSENALIVLDRATKVGDLQPDMAESRGIREPIARRAYAIGEGA